MKKHDEQLIWEAYMIGDDHNLSHSEYEGPDDLEPLARIEPQELESFEEGDLVEIHPRVGGGKGEVVEMSPVGTHGIIELIEDMEDGLEQGDRVAVHISDLSHVNGEEEPVDVDDLDPEDDVPYESNQVGESKESEEALKKAEAAAANPTEEDKARWKRNAAKLAQQGLRGEVIGATAGAISDKSYVRGKDGKWVLSRKSFEKKVDEDCDVCSAMHGSGHEHGKPKFRVDAVKMHDDDLTDDKGPKIKVIKKSRGIPSKILRAIQKVFGGVTEQQVQEEIDWDEDDERDHAHSTAGLAPFSSEEDAGWTPEETIDWHSDDVIKAGAEWLDQELLDAKVNSLEDIHPDLLDDLAGMVIHDMQKAGKLPKRLDYNEYLDERDEYKEAIEDHLGKHFDEMVDHAEDKAVDRGDRPPADYGVDEFPEGDIERVPPGQGLEGEPGELSPYERHRLSINPGGVPPSP